MTIVSRSAARRATRALLATAVLLPVPVRVAFAQTPPAGQVRGSATEHTPASLAAALEGASVSIPARATGGAPFHGLLGQVPATVGGEGRRVPVVVFLHGSSGLSDPIRQWQRWLAESLGIASVAPDGMRLPDRITYTSPVARDVYEKVHAMRARELDAAMSALPTLAWADTARIVIAGTSEGAVGVARYRGGAGVPAERARIVYSWSCEANYHVDAPRNAMPDTLPVLNVMSSTDPYFAPSNAWLGNPAARGHCGDALARNAQAQILLLPQAPHTLFNLPAARGATREFLERALGR
ncbi:MAG: alpha/beta hydrolase [Burkholderiaceae bacterium]